MVISFQLSLEYLLGSAGENSLEDQSIMKIIGVNYPLKAVTVSLAMQVYIN